MANQFRKVVKKVTKNKDEVEPICNPTRIISPTMFPPTSKPMTARVMSIEPDGFLLRVSDTEYFMSFVNFPCFRNAAIEAIKNIEVWRREPNDPDGEFWVYWKMLNVDLGTKQIEWHINTKSNDDETHN